MVPRKGDIRSNQMVGEIALYCSKTLKLEEAICLCVKTVAETRSKIYIQSVIPRWRDLLVILRCHTLEILRYRRLYAGSKNDRTITVLVVHVEFGK